MGQMLGFAATEFGNDDGDAARRSSLTQPMVKSLTVALFWELGVEDLLPGRQIFDRGLIADFQSAADKVAAFATALNVAVAAIRIDY